MRILDRYLVRSFAGPLFFCLILFCMLFIVIDGFNNLDDYIKYSSNLRIVISYYLFLMPALLVQIVPASILVAILYTIGNFNRHHEIIALKASGVSTFQILSPYLFIGILISFSILLINETLVPRSTITSTAIFEGLILKGKKNMGERAIQRVALYGKKQHMIFARELELSDKSLHDVIIFDEQPDRTQRSQTRAKKARYVDGRWVLEEVIRYAQDEKGEMVGEPEVLPELTMDIPDKPEDFIHEATQVDFMSSKQLGEYIGKLRGAGRKLLQRLEVDLYYKLALPFMSAIIMLIGAPLAMNSRRGSAMLGVGTSLFVVVLYYGVESVCLALGKSGALPPFMAAWLSNIIFFAAGIVLVRKVS